MTGIDSTQRPIGRPRSCDCGTCRKCKWRDYMRGYYQSASIERRRRWIAGRDPEAVKRNEARRKRPPDHRERENIRQRTRRAVAAGNIEKKACARCGVENVHAHHEDYSRPLEVMWLCPKHHSERHVERAQAF